MSALSSLTVARQRGNCTRFPFAILLRLSSCRNRRTCANPIDKEQNCVGKIYSAEEQ